MQTESKVKAYILLKATEDEAFRARLLADPKGTVEAEAGFTFPADYTFHVHEESATDAHMILPSSGQLSVQELEAVTGGWTVNTPIHQDCWDENGNDIPCP